MIDKGEKQPNLNSLISQRVGSKFKANGKVWIIGERKEPVENKPKFFIYGFEGSKIVYGSSLYRLTDDFYFFDLRENNRLKFFLLDLRFMFSLEIKANNRAEAKAKAKSIAKTFSIREKITSPEINQPE
jgi:hypothetical protein